MAPVLNGQSPRIDYPTHKHQTVKSIPFALSRLYDLERGPKAAGQPTFPGHPESQFLFAIPLGRAKLTHPPDVIRFVLPAGQATAILGSGARHNTAPPLGPQWPGRRPCGRGAALAR